MISRNDTNNDKVGVPKERNEITIDDESLPMANSRNLCL